MERARGGGREEGGSCLGYASLKWKLQLRRWGKKEEVEATTMREGNEAVELWLEIDEEERERESAGRGTEKLNRRDRGISSQQRRRSPHLPPVKDGPSTMVSENR